MNMKKIGSALTALAMVASMATYVPMASVHAHVAMPDKSNYDGWDSANNSWSDDSLLSNCEKEEAYNSDLAAYNAIKVATYTGTADEAKYTLEVSKMLDSSSVETGKTATLTIEPVTEGAEYAINHLVDGEENVSYLNEIAYVNDLDEATLEALTDNIVIKGAVTSFSVEAIGDVDGVAVVDCLGVDVVAAALETAGNNDVIVETAHDKQANTTLKNHYCADCNEVFNDIEDHNWVADKTTKTHTCECGRVDTDYLNLDADKLETSAENLAKIHDWNEDTHTCNECGAENVVLHQTYINDSIQANVTVEKTPAAHSVTCNGCSAVLSEAEAHTYAPVMKDTVEDDITTEDFNEKEGYHKCTVCGYSHADHEYDNIYKYNTYAKGAKAPSDVEVVVTTVVTVESGSETTIETVKTTIKKGEPLPVETVIKEIVAVSADGVVCDCGAVDPDHTKNGHTYTIQNKTHMCNCGDESTNVHSYIYKINSEGKTINAGNDGIFCGCGAVVDSHTSCEEVYTDKTNHKHFCECGAELAHTYVANTKTHKHECKCGAVDENAHKFTKVYNGLDAEGNLKLVAAATAASGIICEECYAVNPTHKTCDFTGDTSFMANQKHYCACGEYSEEHEYAENGACECGAWKDHECTPDSTNKCICTVCGRHDHSFVVATGKGYHYCEACGLKTTAENFKTLNNGEDAETVHDYSTIDKDAHTHTCDCGAVFNHTEDYLSTDGEETGVTAHECEVCGYDIHTATYCKDGVHYCGNPSEKNTCGYAFDAEDERAHKYNVVGVVNEVSVDTDKCECGRLNPNHVHAVAVCGTATDFCRCNATIAHDWTIVDGTNHKCANTVQTVDVDPETGEQTISETTGAACAQATVAHKYDEDGYCVCGLVKQDLLKNVLTAGETSTMLSTGKYTTAYVVDLEAAAAALRPYLIANFTDANEDTAFVEVITDADKATFEELLAAYTAIYEDMEDNQSAGGAKVMLVTGTKGIELVDAVGDAAIINDQYGVEINIADAIKLTSGYSFAGWYVDEAGTTPASEDDSYLDANYTVKVGNGLQTFYAKAVAKTEKAIIKLPANIAYKGTITGEGKCVNAANKAFVIGEQVTLQLNEEDTTFLYLEDSTGKSHVIDNSTKTYTFTVTGAETFTAATYTADGSGESVYAVFMNDTAEDARVYAYGDAPKASTGFNLQSVLDGAARTNPNKEGYTFKGWYDSTNPDETVISRLKTATPYTLNATSVILKPKFEVISGLHVTVLGGQFASTEDKATNDGDGFAYGTRVGVYAPAQDAKTGKYFSGWYVGDTRVSQQQGYYFTVNADTTIEAKFEGDEPIALVSTITATISRTELDSTNSSGVKKQMVVFNSNREIESGLTVKETGFVYSTKGISSKELLTLDGVNGSTIKKSSGAASTRFGTYTLSMTLGTTPTADVSAVPYVIATDANGEDTVIYGDVYTSTTADLN